MVVDYSNFPYLSGCRLSLSLLTRTSHPNGSGWMCLELARVSKWFCRKQKKNNYSGEDNNTELIFDSKCANANSSTTPQTNIRFFFLSHTRLIDANCSGLKHTANICIYIKIQIWRLAYRRFVCRILYTHNTLNLISMRCAKVWDIFSQHLSFAWQQSIVCPLCNKTAQNTHIHADNKCDNNQIVQLILFINHKLKKFI